MFLFERLVGIGIYMLVLLFACLFLIKTNVRCRSLLRAYLLCLCIMAFFYKPYRTGDLYRIFEQMEYFATMNFEVFWKNYVQGSLIPVSRLLFWIFGKIGVNGLLPAFSAFVCYSLLFYLINKTKELYRISNRTVAIVLFFLMTTSIYISVIGGIRMMLGLCMIAFSYYRGTILKRVTVVDILLYMAAVFTHAVSIVVIGVCVLSLLFDSGKNSLRRVGYGLAALVVAGIFVIYFSDFVRGLYQKFLDYVLGDKYSDPWEYVMGAVIILMLALVFAEFRRRRSDETLARVRKYNVTAVLCMVMALCFFFEFSMFYRFGAHVAVIFAIPSMMITLENAKGRGGIRFAGVDYRSLMILLSLIVAAVSCARGSLCSLKFFEL